MTTDRSPIELEGSCTCVRLIPEGQGDPGSQWAAITAIAAKIGCAKETLGRWVIQSERDAGTLIECESQCCQDCLGDSSKGAEKINWSNDIFPSDSVTLLSELKSDVKHLDGA